MQDGTSPSRKGTVMVRKERHQQRAMVTHTIHTAIQIWHYDKLGSQKPKVCSENAMQPRPQEVYVCGIKVQSQNRLVQDY